MNRSRCDEPPTADFLEAAQADFDLAATRTRLRAIALKLVIFGTLTGRDDRELKEWTTGVEGRASRRS